MKTNIVKKKETIVLKKSSALIIMLCICVLGLTAFDGQKSKIEIAKDVSDKYGNSVVYIIGTIKLSITGTGQAIPPQEQKTEVIGTILDESGLIVTSYIQIEPQITMTARGQEVTIKSEISDIKIIFHDGTELPGKLVMKDPDIDLAFIKIEKEEGVKIPDFTPLKYEASEADILDEVILLERLGKKLKRKLTVDLSRIKASIKKPRTLYVLNKENASMGAPVFTINGKFLGLCLNKEGKLEANNMMGGFDLNKMATKIILPAEEIFETVKQVKDKKEEAKEEKPTETE